MKNSQFNSIVQFDCNKILYNSVYNRLIILNKVSDITIESLKNDIKKVELTNPSLYNRLVNEHFIIESDIDEFLLFKSKYNNIAEEIDSYHLTINPTMGCTFKCWYCYEEHLAGSKLKEDTLERVKLLLSNILQENTQLNKFQLSFFGGEPLIYYKEVCYPIIEEWMKNINKKNNTYIELYY